MVDVNKYRESVSQAEIDYHSGSAASYGQGASSKPNARELGMLQAGLNPGSAVDNAAYTNLLNDGYSNKNSAAGQFVSSNNKQAVSSLYGVVGTNTDTRDWGSIVSSGQSGQALSNTIGAATSAMYGGTTVTSNGGKLYVTSSDGTLLRGIGPTSNPDQIRENMNAFGVSQDWTSQDWQGQADRAIASATDDISKYQQVLADINSTAKQKAEAADLINYAERRIEAAKRLVQDVETVKGFGADVYAPFLGWENTGNINLINGLSEPEEKRRVPLEPEEEETLGVVEQTIQAPQAVAPGTTNVSTGQTAYQQAPQASEAVPTTQTPQATGNTQTPLSTTPFTPTPTTIIGQPVTTGVTGTGIYPQAPVEGTMSTPLQTAGTSAVPASVQVRPNYTGTTTANLTSQSQQGFGGQRTYGNQFGQQITVTVDASGNPITYVPPGYTPVQAQAKGGVIKGYAEGGMSEDSMLEAKYRIATMNGYNGPKTNAALNSFANSSESMKRKFNAIGTVMANKGGLIHKGFAEGGTTEATTTTTPEANPELEQLRGMQKNLVMQATQPQQANVAMVQPQAADFIAPTAGMTTAVAPMAEAAQVGTVQAAQMPMMAATTQMTPQSISSLVQDQTEQMQAAQGTVTPEAQVQAAQQQQTSMADLEAAQGTAYMMSNPVQREIQQGELISGAADAQKAAQFNEQIQAAQATPTKQATVAGQLEGLMQQFEGGETPAWAAGSMRTAMATLSERGLGASSMAGQAVIQATMEAALPIAQLDAQTTAQFEAQNLSNRQQRAMLAAQQRAQFLGQEFDQAFQARVANSARIGDIANMNFTAEQNIALENSRAANTINLSNLSNRQAMVMAEAAALSNLDMANLNNRQQAAVQNAQNFLQMDMTNLNNEQQTTMFKTQQNLQALFTDQAAENAASQFNASSENQTNQFFAKLSSQTSQFNASQRNAMDQFNVNSVNALREFNSEIQQQRDMFNAQNGLIIAQSNAQWRQNIATMNTAAQNESNMNFAKTINGLTAGTLDQIWQRERDVISYAWQGEQNQLDRDTSVLLGDKKLSAADESGKGSVVGNIVAEVGSNIISSIFG